MTTDRHLLKDIELELGPHRLRPVYSVGERRRRVPRRRPQGPASELLADFATVEGRDNLGQAIILRLLTRRGELAALGHPDYGSRVEELIGRPNSATNRDLLRLFILESLAREPRIESVERIVVTPHPEQRTRVDVTLEVLPVASSTTVTIGPFTLRFAS